MGTGRLQSPVFTRLVADAFIRPVASAEVQRPLLNCLRLPASLLPGRWLFRREMSYFVVSF